MQQIIVDTGPLVAFVNRRDRYHQWARDVFGRLAPPFSTCEAVLSEACYLLKHFEQGSHAILTMVSRGLLTLPFRVDASAESLDRLIATYRDVQMDLADACLVRLAELLDDPVIVTVDGDFRVYRMHKRQVIPTIMP